MSFSCIEVKRKVLSIDDKLNIIIQLGNKIGVMNKQQVMDVFLFVAGHIKEQGWNWKKNTLSERSKLQNVKFGENKLLENILLQ